MAHSFRRAFTRGSQHLLRQLEPATRALPISKIDAKPYVSGAKLVSRYTAYGIAGFSAAGFGFVLVDGFNAPTEAGEDRALSSLSFVKLLQGHFVFTCCSIPQLIDASPWILENVLKLPVISQIGKFFIRHTFFFQFVAGESAQDSLPVIQLLRHNDVGTLFCYNVEANYNKPADCDISAQIEETLNAIKTAGEFEKLFSTPEALENGDTRSWVSIKMSGLISDPKVLRRRTALLQTLRLEDNSQLGVYPFVPVDGDWERLWSHSNDPQAKSDAIKLATLYDTLNKIISKAKELGVVVFIDAEQTWYQPAIDVIQEKLMATYNRDGPIPIVGGTFQAYLKRNEKLLITQLQRAQEGGYKLGVKLVRGAYMDAERRTGLEEGKEDLPPVWDDKDGTDACYMHSVDIILKAMMSHQDNPQKPDCLAILASHNADTVKSTHTRMVDLGMTRKVDEDIPTSSVIKSEYARRIAFAQLVGMKNGLTGWVASNIVAESGIPMVMKCVVYGPLNEAMPYLARRAAENKSLMSGEDGAKKERQRLAAEVVKRIW